MSDYALVMSSVKEEEDKKKAIEDLLELALSDRSTVLRLGRITSKKVMNSIRMIGEKRKANPNWVESAAKASREACNRPEWIAKNKEVTAKRAVQVVNVENGSIFLGSQSAARVMGLSSGNITDTCKGRHKTTGGYHWRYASPEEVAYFWAERERTGTDGPFPLTDCPDSAKIPQEDQ